MKKRHLSAGSQPDAPRSVELEALALLAHASVKVDIVDAVMPEVRRIGPLRRRGLSRAACAWIGLATAGLAAQGAWVLWVVLTGGQVTEAMSAARTAWSFGRFILGSAMEGLQFVARMLGSLGQATGPAADALAPLLPLWTAAVIASLVLLLAGGFGLARVGSGLPAAHGENR